MRQTDDPTIFAIPHSSPAERLAASVLNRAVLDLFMKGKKVPEGDAQPTFAEKQEAIRFLVSAKGD